MTASDRSTSGRGLAELLPFLAGPMLALLVAEFLLGMALNLWVALPSGDGVGALLTSPVLLAHVALAVLLVGISARAVVIARRLDHREAIGASSLALLSAILASVAGWAFTFGGQSAGEAYAMAAGFAGVLVGAFLLLGLRGRLGPTSPRGGA